MRDQGPWVERIFRVIDYIHAHLDDEVSPEELARVAHFSLHHFHRVFRGMTGESVMGFVRRLRLERAAQRLKFGSEPVVEVALSTGYASHEAFTRAFRARFGTNPSAYRSQERVRAVADLDIAVRAEPERHCVGLRYVGSYGGCAAAWRDLAAIGVHAGFAARAGGSLGLVYDDPDVTADHQLRYDACLVLPEDALPESMPDRCVRRSVPAGRYAVAHHVGPYDSLEETYVALLGRWLPYRDVELSDEPVVEIYLNNPDEVVPEDLRTDVCVRIE